MPAGYRAIRGASTGTGRPGEVECVVSSPPGRFPLPILLLSGLCALALAVPARAQEPGAAGERPQVRAVRTDTPPVIDGFLDDAAWSEAELLSPLTQVEPVEGARPSERTEIRFLYDAEALYVAIRAFDADPDGIIANQLARDGSLRDNDRVGLIFDTFLNHRTGYFFGINPAGARFDALVPFRREWDGIWYGKAQIDAEGWTAELAIPFKTLSFDPGTTRWGLNVTRGIRGRTESLRWASPYQNKFSFDLATAGELTGLEGLEQGLGLDVKPGYAVTQVFQHRPKKDNDLLGDPSLDVFYKITPSMTAALTANTDFSAVEVDEIQVNLTRFSLFFPEKRDFFLEDVSIFDFGGLREENGLPFFSRRIGLDPDGEPIPIRGAAKVTGRAGRLNIGLLDTQVASSGDLDSKNLGVARVLVNVLEESTVGGILTFGDPATNGDNFVAGADFNYKTSRVFGNQTLEGNLWFQHSGSTGLPCPDEDGDGVCDADDNCSLVANPLQEDVAPMDGIPDACAVDTNNDGVADAADTDGDGVADVMDNCPLFPNLDQKDRDVDGIGDVCESLRTESLRTGESAFGARLRYPNDRVRFNLEFKEIQGEFRPSLGFTNRTSTRSYEADFRYRIRPEGSWVRFVDFGFDSELFTNDDDGHLEDVELGLDLLRIESQAGDFVEFEFKLKETRLTEPFVISPNATIAPGRYSYERFRARAEVSQSRRFSPALEIAVGEFFDGDLVRVNPIFRARPSPHIFLLADYQHNDIRLPAGNFTTRLWEGRIDFLFNPDVSWRNLIQYDNVTESFGVQSTLRWIVEPGNDLFLVLTTGHVLEDETLKPTKSQIALKGQWTFRF